MDYNTLIVKPGAIAQIIFNRPERRNSLTGEMLEEIASALYKLDEDEKTRVIIISGAGKGFCAGAELDSLIPGQSVIDSKKNKAGLIKTLTAMSKIGKVLISQVHGFALAGGFGLATAPDLTIVADNALLGLPEVKRGLFAYNVMNPISKLMPRKFLLEMLFTGDNISPQKAVEWGLANRVTTPDKLEEETMALAENIARHSPSAIRLGKESFYNMAGMDYYAAFNYLTDMLVINACTQDSKEGVAAFFEKRDPVWTGK